MSWIYIPADTGERISEICNKHFKRRGACNCPLWPACNYANDLSKTDAENTRIFEMAMAAALAAIEEQNKK